MAGQDAEGPHGASPGLADIIDENAEELARLESQNVGKPWWVAVDEPGVMSDCLRFFAGAARNLEGKAAGEYVEGYTSMIRREPLGIVAGICPWNYPLFMAIWKIGPALAAGNVQIIKPAEQRRSRCSASSSSRRRSSRPGVLQVVTGDDSCRRCARATSRRPPRLAHGRHGDREDHRECGSDREARAPRARRQGADGRARRRRPGHGRRGDQDRRLLQLGPGLHGVVAHPRQPQDLRRRALRDREGGRVDERRRPVDGRRDRHGAGHLAEQQERVLGFLERASSTKATIVTGGESPATAASS